MAKWRLVTPHYLNNPEGEWEYKETDRNTGKQARKTFAVPLYMEEGTVVTNNIREVSPRDNIYHFTGDPTPDMDPLDDEAEAISASFAGKWQHPIDSLPGDFSQSLITSFQQQMAELSARQPAQAAVAAPGVSAEDFKDLLAQVQSLAAQNADLMAKLEAGPAEDLEPLPDDSVPPPPVKASTQPSRRA